MHMLRSGEQVSVTITKNPGTAQVDDPRDGVPIPDPFNLD
jgi:hypothetical protein